MPIIYAGLAVAAVVGSYVWANKAGEAMGEEIGRGTGDALRIATVGSVLVIGYVYIRKNG